MAELRCYMMRYTVEGGESGIATVIDRTEDEARRTVVSHFDYHGKGVVVNKIRRVSMVEGGYVLMADEGKNLTVATVDVAHIPEVVEFIAAAVESGQDYMPSARLVAAADALGVSLAVGGRD